MKTFRFFQMGLITITFIGGAMGLVLPIHSQAELFKKESFAGAPLVQKIFEKTVCGIQYSKTRFVTSKDGKKVCDRTTGNVWEQNPNEPDRDSMNWESAIEFCENLGEGHGKRYQLPTVQQLESVLDYSESSPAVTPGVFDGLLSVAQYWTSTPFPPSSDSEAYVVQIAGGQVLATNMSNTRRIWCVQGGKKKHNH